MDKTLIVESYIRDFVAAIDHPYLLLLLDRVTKERLEQVGVSKSRGNPVGEYAEYLVAQALDGQRMANAKEGHDITLADGSRLEVKGRIFEGRRVPMNYFKHSTIEKETFDSLAFVVFNENMTVRYGYRITLANFKLVATFAKQGSKWVFVASPKYQNDPKVENISELLLKVQQLEPTGSINPSAARNNPLFAHSISSLGSKPKYEFDGHEYNFLNRLVLAVVKKHVVTNPTIDAAGLLAAFPKKLQGGFGVFDTAQNASLRDSKRFFSNPTDLIELQDCKVAVCNQWGKNIDSFIYHASDLGHKINKLSPDVPI